MHDGDELSTGSCHCGGPVHVYEDGFTRDLCEPCSTVRCDLESGPCSERKDQRDG